MSAGEFIARRLLGFSAMCAFASLAQQIEGLFGNCGLYKIDFYGLIFDCTLFPIPGLKIALYGAAFLCGLHFFNGLSKAGNTNSSRLSKWLHVSDEFISGLGVFYLLTQLLSKQAINDGIMLTSADVLLAEVMILSHPIIWSSATWEFLVFRILFSSLVGKIYPGCQDNYFDLLGLKFDAINQPFPFAPVWQLNKLPDSAVSALTLWIFMVEAVLGLGILFAGGYSRRNKSPEIQSREISDSKLKTKSDTSHVENNFEHIMSLSAGFESFSLITIFTYSLFFMLIGNFNWSLPLLAALAVALMPTELVEAVLGKDFLLRWNFKSTLNHGVDSNDKKRRHALEVLVLNAGAFSVVFHIVWAVVYFNGGSYIWKFIGGFSNMLQYLSVASFVGLAFFVVRSLTENESEISSSLVFVKPQSSGFLGNLKRFLWAVVFFVGSKDALMIVLANNGRIPSTYAPDFSLGLACSTLNQQVSGLHTRVGRNSLLFSARVDAVFPEDRHAEFSTQGSVHIEDFRPSHLLFHLPRISLAVWRASTKAYAKSTDHVLARIRHRLLNGHGSLQNIFADAPQSRLRRVVGQKVKDAFVYYQQYVLTERFADHQWYTKTNKYGIVVDSKNAGNFSEPLEECPLGNSFVNSIPVQSAVVTSALAALVLKLMFLP